MEQELLSRPLAGLTVLDLTRVLAGPFVGMLFYDLGARVIKIENPDGGDEARDIGPFKGGVSGYFMSVNKGKESLALDLKHPEGKEIFLNLCDRADILVENFRPGVTERLGLGYDVLSRRNPGLIYLGISGFGRSGPMRDRPAYDMIVQAMSGIMSITGPEGGEPVRVGASVSDLAAALFGVIGVLAKLNQRQQTGKGGLVDVAMYDSTIALLENAIVRTHLSGKPPTPLGTRHPSIAPFQAFTTKDGYIIVAIGNNRLWDKFCRALNRADLRDDRRFQDNESRTKNHLVLEEEFNREFKGRSTADWLNILEKVEVPSAPLQNVAEMMDHPQTEARRMVETLVHNRAGSFKTAGFPIKLDDAPSREPVPAPDLGQHSKALLKEILNLDKKRLNELMTKGVIYFPGT